jgi:hypothetical protein
MGEQGNQDKSNVERWLTGTSRFQVNCGDNKYVMEALGEANRDPSDTFRLVG